MAGGNPDDRPSRAAPGAQLTFTDIDGHRFQVFVTDLTDPDICYLEALSRGRGRAERRICDAKDTGLANLPSGSFALIRRGSPPASSPPTCSPGPGPPPRRRPRPGRTEEAPLPAVPHRRPHHHQRPAPLAPPPHHLALVRPARHRLRTARRHPPPDLTEGLRHTGTRTHTKPADPAKPPTLTCHAPTPVATTPTAPRRRQTPLPVIEATYRRSGLVPPGGIHP